MKNINAKKNRFNIVDFVLVITILACIIGITIRYNLSETLIQSQDSATVTVMIRGLLEENADQLVVGDPYFYQTSGKPFGTLTSVTTSPAKNRYFKDDGTVYVSEYPNRVDAVCTLEIEGYNSKDGFMIDGATYVGIGSDILVRSMHLETQWLVLDIEVHE